MDFNQILKSRYIETNDYFQFVDLENKNKEHNFKIVSPRGEDFVYINDNNLSKFYLYYCENHHLIDSNVYEKLIDIPPLIIDIKLYFSIMSDIDVNDSFILEIIYYLQQFIKDNFDLTDNKELTCLKLEKEIDTDENESIYSEKTTITMDSDSNDALMHIVLIFPFFKCPINIQHDFILKKVKDICNSNRTISKVNPVPKNSWNDAKHKIMELPLLQGYHKMYSESDFMPNEIDVIGVLSREDTDKSIDEIDNIYQLEYLDLSYFSLVNNGSMTKQSLIDNGDYKYWLPLLTSQRYYYKETKKKEIERTINKISRTKEQEKEEVKFCRTFLQMLSKKRWSNHMYWLKIGQAIHHHTKSSDQGVKLWMDYTIKNNHKQICQEYCGKKNDSDEHQFCHQDDKERECLKKFKLEIESIYSNFVNGPITIKTLAYMARQDSPQDYNNWHKKWYHKYIDEAFSLNFDDIARLFYHIYWLEYCYVPGIKEWYYFRDHTWNISPENLELLQDINEKFGSKIKDIIYKIDLDINTIDDNEELEKKLSLINKKEKLQSIHKIASDIDKKTKIVKSLKVFFKVNDFNKYANKNLNLTGTPNGIIEVSDTNIIHRPGIPEDYVTIKTNSPLRMDYNWDHPDVKDVLEWTNKMFACSDKLHDYFWRYMASILIGGNNEKYFVVMTGDGNNSKTMWNTTLQSVLGEHYCGVVPISTLCEFKKGSSGPSPEIARLENCRMVISSESGKDHVLQSHFVKLITGNGKIFARKCNQDGGEISIQYKFALETNNVPVMSEADDATAARVVIVPTKSKFTEKAPQSIEEQYKTCTFPLDKTFHKKAKKIAPAILWIMYHKYPDYLKFGLDEKPDECLEATKNYWENKDMFKNFIANKIEFVDDLKSAEYSINITNLYSVFKQWFTFCYSGSKITNQSDFKTEMARPKRLGLQRNNKWWGIKIKEDEDDQNNLRFEKKSPKYSNDSPTTIFRIPKKTSKNSVTSVDNQDVPIQA